jgi:exonuclease III
MRLAELITSGIVEKIALSETQLTADDIRSISEFLKNKFPDVKLVAIPMSSQTNAAMKQLSPHPKKSETTTDGFSGVGMLMHISWFQRLTNKITMSQNLCAGRLLELIFTHNGEPPKHIDGQQTLVEFVIYAVSGSRASTDVGQAIMKTLSSELEKKIRNHLTRNHQIIVMGDFNAAQIPEIDRMSRSTSNPQDYSSFNIHNSLSQFQTKLHYINTQKLRTLTFQKSTTAQEGTSLIDYVVAINFPNHQFIFQTSTATTTGFMSGTHRCILYSISENPIPIPESLPPQIDQINIPLPTESPHCIIRTFPFKPSQSHKHNQACSLPCNKCKFIETFKSLGSVQVRPYRQLANQRISGQRSPALGVKYIKEN